MERALETLKTLPRHHPPAELLVDYAAGALSDAEALLVGLHLDACPACHADADAAFAVGGALLDAIPPARLPTSLFQRMLTVIDNGMEHSQSDAALPVPAFAHRWPQRLRDHLARHPTAHWRWLPAGFRALRVPVDDQVKRLWLMMAPGGRGPLKHRHHDAEWTLVLQGGFTDETGSYAAGDFAIMDAGEQHQVTAEPGEGCVGLILLRSNPEYLTLPGKILAPLLKL